MLKRKELPYEDAKIIHDTETVWRMEQARKTLSWFLKYTKDDYKPNWHHIETCRALRKWINGEIQNLIISQPPRHGKSQIASIHLPAFLLGQNPDARIISASYSASLASKMNRSVQKLIDSYAYQQLFPGTRLSGTGVSVPGIKALKNSEEFEVVGRRGTYRSAGVGGGITGMGADYFIIDDPIKNDEEANSEAYREGVWEWWLSTALTRLEENSRVLLIMTRWHEDDLAGRLLAQQKADPTSLKWHEVRFDAIREDMTMENDPRVFGEPLWPQKYPLGRLETLKSSLGPRWWNSLYQQRPTALEGGIIKAQWLKYYTELPPVFHKYIQSWDLNFKESDGNDFVVGQVWGVYSGKRYLLDQVRGRWGFTETCQQMDQLTQKWPKARRKLVEEKANGAAVLDAMKRKGLNEDGTIRQPITGLVPIVPTESKSARLTSCATDFQAGDVLLPHPSIAPWVQVLVDELVKFPNARYDDCADTASQALNDLAGGRQTVLEKITRL